MDFSNTMRDHLQFMCHLRMLDNQVFTKLRMSSDLIINAPLFLPKKWRMKTLHFVCLPPLCNAMKPGHLLCLHCGKPP